MASEKTKRRHENGGIEGEMAKDTTVAEYYEQSREQRIKDNLQKMQKLGILELSRNINNLKPKTTCGRGRPPGKRKPSSSSSAAAASIRRSSRLKTMQTVSYHTKRASKPKILMDAKPEVYTEEHEKMLGDHKETWTLWIDGYYFEGKSTAFPHCHQCGRKIADVHTKCCKCKNLGRPFCGNCLFMRYGENVLEANANPDWVCPLCRVICNCGLCRRAKGWEPIGNFYKKALHLGFKSIAHYLIHTYGPHGNQGDRDKEASKDSLNHDNKLILTKKDIKRYDHDQKCKGDDDIDDDVDPNYESDLQDDSNEDD